VISIVATSPKRARTCWPARIGSMPRIAAFFDYIIEQREALKPILTG
jgi:hypothetical protein